MSFYNLSGKKITVLGAARSGIAVAKMLQKVGAKVFLSENGSEDKFFGIKDILLENNIIFEFGKHSEKVFDASMFVVSPGIPSDAQILQEAKKRNIQIESEIETAFRFCKSPVVAITGSAGKTTTTTLLGRMVSDAKKKHFVAGNIGTPLSSFVLESTFEDVAIVEVSSFQLDYCSNFKPHISVMTNITQNHLDRYSNSIENYAESKSKIFQNQTNSDYLIFNADDFWSNKIVKNRKNNAVKLLPFSLNSISGDGAYLSNREITLNINGKTENIISVDELSFKGVHNIYNALVATLAARLLNISTASIRSTLKNFKGVEHRQEFVAEIDGISFINDSKSTTTDSVKYAIEAVSSPIILILGGKDKGNDYTQIEKLVSEKVKLIIAIGASAEKIENHFKKFVKVEKINTTNSAIPNIDDLKKSIETAKNNSKLGDVILFSPACASFDWFNNYEERGEIFKKLVLNK